jgi:hypothetical protein
MMHLLQFPKNVHFLQEAAAVVDAVDTVEIAAAADEAVAADVHSVEVAAEVVHLLAEDAADHVVAVKLEAEAVQAVHANLNNKLCKSPESLMRFRTFFVLWAHAKVLLLDGGYLKSPILLVVSTSSIVV